MVPGLLPAWATQHPENTEVRHLALKGMISRE
jgi:hypothetical protein